jgi:hypothetical protein
MAEVVSRFPVIEGLVAILYGRKQRGEYISSKEDIKCANWVDCERGCWSMESSSAPRVIVFLGVV